MERKEVVGIGALVTAIIVTVAGDASENGGHYLDPFSDSINNRQTESLASPHVSEFYPEINGEKRNIIYEYMFRGTTLRRELKILKENEDPNYKLLNDLYSKQKKEKRVEYLDGNADVFDPQIGDSFTIDDPSKLKPGVVLRVEPNIDINRETDTKAVYNGAIVEIAGLGVTVLGFDLSENVEIEKTLYPVKVVTPSIDFYNGDSAMPGEIGYVPKEYLGNKVNVVPWN